MTAPFVAGPNELVGNAPLTPAPSGARPAIVGVGTAVSPRSYTQDEVLDYFGITDERVRSVFHNSAIERRYLTLPPTDSHGRPVTETQGDLLRKHGRLGVELGAAAVRACVEASGRTLDDLGYLCCVSSSGLLIPGLSALLIKDMGLSPRLSRLDVVGMGCNAGLNALNAVAGWSTANPGRVALMVCVEVCSAAYVLDATMRTSVVNSLFGDGAAAVAVSTGAVAVEPGPAPRLLRFASHIIPEASGAMGSDWDDTAGKFRFFLDRDVPSVLGADVETVVDRLLDGTGLGRGDVAHWVIHSGGKKIVESVRSNLGLTRHDVRHTIGVLRDYGNLSSCSFLFSYERLLDEGIVNSGEYGVLMTMGPGLTIESALVRF
ncbi:3,5-dihydroxyphenylacetyl-CoA synthase DpgA [Streptomyces sp. NPDC059679]|uniref:3,5-dihydroxyphenylacetyl-CoA synthase DpgA n=1 Tax=Streptomyces sp. NPDC059679 TaxID=3346903 RepID=UPI0036C1DDCA